MTEKSFSLESDLPTIPHKHTILVRQTTAHTMSENKEMVITASPGDGVVGALPQLELAQRAGKDDVRKEVFNVDVWCVVFEKVSRHWNNTLIILS